MQAPRSLAAGAGWLAAALVATVAGLGGIRLVGDSLTGTAGGVLSEQEVSRALAAATPSASSPAAAGPSSAPASSPTAATPTAPASRPPTLTSFPSSGGTALAGCLGNRAFLENWSPKPGYEVRDVDEGPDDEAEVRFESAGRHVDLKITCVGGVPRAAEHANHGGDD